MAEQGDKHDDTSTNKEEPMRKKRNTKPTEKSVRRMRNRVNTQLEAVNDTLDLYSKSARQDLGFSIDDTKYNKLVKLKNDLTRYNRELSNFVESGNLPKDLRKYNSATRSAQGTLRNLQPAINKAKENVTKLDYKNIPPQNEFVAQRTKEKLNEFLQDAKTKGVTYTDAEVEKLIKDKLTGEARQEWYDYKNQATKAYKNNSKLNKVANSAKEKISPVLDKTGRKAKQAAKSAFAVASELKKSPIKTTKKLGKKAGKSAADSYKDLKARNYHTNISPTTKKALLGAAPLSAVGYNAATDGDLSDYLAGTAASLYGADQFRKYDLAALKRLPNAGMLTAAAISKLNDGEISPYEMAAILGTGGLAASVQQVNDFRKDASSAKPLDRTVTDSAGNKIYDDPALSKEKILEEMKARKALEPRIVTKPKTKLSKFGAGATAGALAGSLLFRQGAQNAGRSLKEGTNEERDNIITALLDKPFDSAQMQAGDFLEGLGAVPFGATAALAAGTGTAYLRNKAYDTYNYNQDPDGMSKNQAMKQYLKDIGGSVKDKYDLAKTETSLAYNKLAGADADVLDDRRAELDSIKQRSNARFKDPKLEYNKLYNEFLARGYHPNDIPEMIADVRATKTGVDEYINNRNPIDAPDPITEAQRKAVRKYNPSVSMYTDEEIKTIRTLQQALNDLDAEIKKPNTPPERLDILRNNASALEGKLSKIMTYQGVNPLKTTLGDEINDIMNKSWRENVISGANALQNTFDSASTTVKSAVDDARAAKIELEQNLRNKTNLGERQIKRVLKQFDNAVQNGSATVSEALTSVYEKVKSKRVKNVVTNILENARSTAGNAVNTAGNAAGQAVEAAGNRVNRVSSDIDNVFSSIVNKADATTKRTLAQVYRASEAGGASADEAWGKVKDYFNEVANNKKASRSAKKLAGELASAYDSVINYGVIPESAQKFAQNTKGRVNELTQAIKKRVPGLSMDEDIDFRTLRDPNFVPEEPAKQTKFDYDVDREFKSGATMDTKGNIRDAQGNILNRAEAARARGSWNPVAKSKLLNNRLTNNRVTRVPGKIGAASLPGMALETISSMVPTQAGQGVTANELGESIYDSVTDYGKRRLDQAREQGIGTALAATGYDALNTTVDMAANLIPSTLQAGWNFGSNVVRPALGMDTGITYEYAPKADKDSLMNAIGIGEWNPDNYQPDYRSQVMIQAQKYGLDLTNPVDKAKAEEYANAVYVPANPDNEHAYELWSDANPYDKPVEPTITDEQGNVVSGPGKPKPTPETKPEPTNPYEALAQKYDVNYKGNMYGGGTPIFVNKRGDSFADTASGAAGVYDRGEVENRWAQIAEQRAAAKRQAEYDAMSVQDKINMAKAQYEMYGKPSVDIKSYVAAPEEQRMRMDDISRGSMNPAERAAAENRTAQQLYEKYGDRGLLSWDTGDTPFMQQYEWSSVDDSALRSTDPQFSRYDQERGVWQSTTGRTIQVDDPDDRLRFGATYQPMDDTWKQKFRN